MDKRILKEWTINNFIIELIINYFLWKKIIIFDKQKNIQTYISMIEQNNNLNKLDKLLLKKLKELSNDTNNTISIKDLLKSIKEIYFFIWKFFTLNKKDKQILKLYKNIEWLKEVLNNYTTIFYSNRSLSKETKILLDILYKYSDENYIVWWFNRDLLVWKEPKDVDIISLIPIDELEKILIKELKNIDVIERYKIDWIWKHFWILMVNINNESFEIANPRKDKFDNWIEWKWADNVEIINNIIEDSQRRDFTINQFYFNVKYWILLDFNWWIKDIINKEINFIWNWEKRIEEDVLRILRVYKFIKKWFNPSKKTLWLIRSNFHLLCKLWNPTRIQQEFEKILL